MTTNPLIGRWGLVSYETRSADGQISYPLGEHRGEGAGRRELYWVGMDQERLVELAGNRLTLSARPMLLAGRERSAHLIWERV